MTPPGGPGQILQTLQAFQSSAILNAAIELGVFAAADGPPKTASQIGKAIGAPERSTGILLDALCGMGLLHKDARKYRLGGAAAAHLVPGRNGYVGDAARIMCAPTFWDAMGRYAQAVRHGGTVLKHHAESPDCDFWETFAQNSASFASPSADYVADILGRFLEARPAARVLDVACGSGIYGLTLARRFPQARVTLLDRGHVLSAARRHAHDLGVHGRVELLAADMFEGDLGGPYDAVIASQVFHHFSPAHCEKLARRLGKVTRPGGRLVVHEFVADENRSSAAPALLFAAVMLAWTREGTTYTYSEYTKFLSKGGYLAPILHAPPQMNSQFLLAERRARRAAGRR